MGTQSGKEGDERRKETKCQRRATKTNLLIIIVTWPSRTREAPLVIPFPPSPHLQTPFQIASIRDGRRGSFISQTSKYNFHKITKRSSFFVSSNILAQLPPPLQEPIIIFMKWRVERQRSSRAVPVNPGIYSYKATEKGDVDVPPVLVSVLFSWSPEWQIILNYDPRALPISHRDKVCEIKS